MDDHNTHANGQGNRRGGRKRPPNEDDLTEEDKAKRQKNRDAAKKCRLRKQVEASSMKEQNQDLEKQNMDLTRKKIDLEHKIRECLKIIEHHKSHGCQLPDELEILLNGDLAPENTFVLGQRSDNPLVLQPEQLHSQIRNGSRDNISDSKIPTGLFSGAQLQTNQVKQKESSFGLPKPQNPDCTITESQMHFQENSITLEDQNRLVQFNENGESQYMSSSPVQRVPNIDQMPLSPHSSKLNCTYDSGEDDYLPRSVASSSGTETPQNVNITSSVVNHLSGGYVVNNRIAQSQQMVSRLDFAQQPQIIAKTTSVDNKANCLITYKKNRMKNNQSSCTQSLQATTELISQAIHDIHPSEISKSFHAQMVECTKSETASASKIEEGKDYFLEDSTSLTENQEEMQDKVYPQFEYESKPQQQPSNLNEVARIVMPDTSYSYETIGTAEPNILTVPTSLLSQYCIIAQPCFNHRGGGHPQQYTPLIINTGQPIPQTGLPVEVEDTVQESQIPTTVLNDEDDNETSVHNNNGRIPTSVEEEQDAGSGRVDGMILPSLIDYSANVSELPSLSFNDLKNQPKEIFDKKPSRLNGQFTK